MGGGKPIDELINKTVFNAVMDNFKDFKNLIPKLDEQQLREATGELKKITELLEKEKGKFKAERVVNLDKEKSQ